ncbi:MAG: response regulator [Bacteroidales bacterium]|nr:response regulator [Bacteroidales bacterium]
MEQNIHILIVDDNQENLRVVSNYLKDNGYKLALAQDGINALEIVKNNKIDLILLDIMMPDMDGFEVCEKLKENPDTKNIPVIFLTAKTDTEDIVKGFHMGGVDYITKPFKKEELYARVNNHVELKLMRDYLRQLAKENKGSRNAMMNMLLDFGKLIDP